MDFSKKVQNLSASITLEITKVANEMREQGLDVINFAAGELNFNTSENIQKAAFDAIKNGKIKYTAVSGLSDLKKSITKKLKTDNNLEYNENQILVSTGAKQCIANIFMAIINDGDEVIIPAPYWVSYPEIVKISGGKPVFIDVSEKNNFKITGKDLEKACNKKTKAVILNSPNNPTGAIYTYKELLELAKVASEKNIFIISDEIYEKIIFDNEKHISIASISEDAYKRTIVVNGFSKAYAMTGWRIGYIAGDKSIIELIGKVQGHITGNANTISQYSAIEALKTGGEYIFYIRNEIQSRKDYIVKLLKQIPKISFIIPKGTFYIFVNIKSILNTSVKNSLEFSKELLKNENIAVIPGEAFGKEGYIRISFTNSLTDIKEGIERFENFIKNLN